MKTPTSQDFFNCGIATGLLTKTPADQVPEGFKLGDLIQSLWYVTHFAGDSKIAREIVLAHLLDMAAFAPGNGDVCEIIARRTRETLKQEWLQEEPQVEV